MPKGNQMTFSMEVKGLDEAVRKLKVYDTRREGMCATALKAERP